MNYEELLNDLGSMINQTDDSGDFIGTFVTEAEAKRWINQAFQRVYKNYALTNAQRFGTGATTDTVSDRAVYTFGGDAVDLLAVATVGIKYSADDSFYRTATKLNKNKAYKYGNEEWSKSNPAFFERNIYNTETGRYELAIEFPKDCVPEEDIDDAIKVTYIEAPPKLVGMVDIPEKLPEEFHSFLVTGAGAKAFRKMGEDRRTQSLQREFDKNIAEMLREDQSLVAGKPLRLRLPKEELDTYFRYKG